MEEPNYVLKTYVKDKKPIKGKQPFSAIRIVVWIIVAIIIIGSLIFGENLFFELSWTARGILISLIISSFLWGPKKQEVSMPMEIRFYGDYFIIYMEKVYYTTKIARMEYWKFKYNGVTRWEYNYLLKRLDLIGNTEATWYDYNDDGTVPEEPTYHRYVEGGICSFYVWGNDADNIISSLEEVLIVKPLLFDKPEEKQ